MSSRKAYDGTQRRIVIAFDVGTTYSGISYSILDPGQTPVIKGVTRFPAQETISGASKIPTIIYYDGEGNVKAVGAEATRDGIYEASLEGSWYKAEWFKLHLRSKFGTEKTLHTNVPPLPPNKTVVDVFADYLRYLLHCTASYIQDTYPNGPSLWTSLQDNLYFVLSHPNGWEGREQSQMRQAALMAGLVPDTTSGHSRIVFVTEGEASLHFAIENGVLSQAMEREGISIVDAGGGTIDVSTYRRVPQLNHRIFEEIVLPESYFHGAAFVTLNAKDRLKVLLDGSAFADDLDHITNCFDRSTKPRFRSAKEPQYIKFGSARDNDQKRGIRFGQVKLAGTDVAKFFQPSIDCIAQAAKAQKQSSHDKISHVVLVGGFAASDWLFEQVKILLTRKGFAVIRPENYVNKAVSDGAISCYLDHYVRTRVARVTYGSRVTVPYVDSDPEHVKRAALKFIDVDGTPMLPYGFRPILPKNSQVSETKEFTRRLTSFFSDAETSSCLETTLMCYRGSQKNPQWTDTEPDNFTAVCTLVADISRIPRQINESARKYYSVTFDVVVNFGLTELQAHLRWWEEGVEHRSPVKLIYDMA